MKACGGVWRVRGVSLLAVFAVVGALNLDTLAMGPKLSPGSLAGKAGERRPEGAEGAIVGVFRLIAEDRVAAAHAELDRLLAVNPNFRLAQLVKGDLLLARAQPIHALGNAAGVPEERLNDLREEARARLLRQRGETPKDRLPRYLLKMAPQQRHAIVVDTSRSSLYVFENRDGVPHYVTDYYVTIGKNGTDKAREGDKKTPLGVYNVTGSLPVAKLGDFYGSGAFPISYPNEWDRRAGRNGHGIWLHGTPRDTYSRPPRASDGCVVLTNEDLEALSRRLQLGATPVIISGGVDWVAESDLSRVRSSLEETVEAWRRDWESRDTGRYLRHYAAGFSSGTMNLAQWAEQKRAVNAGKTWVKVKVGEVSMFLYPGAEPLAVVTFLQDYQSNNLGNVMRKRQYWMRDGDAWKIAYEGAV
ncbi:MAG: L,D-transpeptidase [Rhodocyclaceae bacterium]|jgi:murein L,D-transpeptidase YafK|nr:L,D-transpeptidase [Rhodocyclaceae bacterium]MCA3136208.1 L,D-transpeptidase [Rhodocyclaceae bacterium]MCA3142873.1 L,D-transpeptidase [Rhodocyclaceae bacterium]MCA3144967.1 L,D-transpeptidase [Rhodocyclaceae bacterium]